MILLSADNPVYNTIIVFSIIMLLLYLTKPDVIYDNERREFRQFGTTDGKTLLPIYVVGILLAIILYVFFHFLSLRRNSDKLSTRCTNVIYEQDITEDANLSKKNDEYRYIIQQQQIHQLQNQLMQQQILVQQLTSYNK